MNLANIRPIAKAVVAVAGAVVVIASQVASGHFDSAAIVASVAAALTALGVHQVKNG